MEIKRNIKIDIYGCKLSVVITDNMEDTIKKYLKKFKIPYEDGFYYGLFLSPPHELDPDAYYILFNKKELSINTISHECYHACSRILKDRGVGMEDEEPMAYLLGYVVQEVLNAVISERINISNGAK